MSTLEGPREHAALGSQDGFLVTVLDMGLRVFHSDQTVLLLLKTLKNFCIVHPLTLLTVMRSRG